MTNAQKQPLQPVYLIIGDDDLKKDATIKRLRARLAQTGDIEFNSDIFEGESLVGQDIVVACNTLPFASDYRLVEVRGIDSLLKADSEALVAYLKAPNAQTVLALIGDKLAKTTKLYKAIAGFPQAIITCDLPKQADVPKMIKSMAVSQRVVFTDGAARLLADFMGNDTIALQSEIKKIALAHEGNDPVTEAEIRALAHDNSQSKIWDLITAYANHDLAECLRLLPRLKNESAFGMLSLLQSCIRDLMAVRALSDKGQAAIAAELKKKDWQIRNLLRQARNHTSASLEFALEESVDAELALKTGANQQRTIEDFIIKTLTSNL